VLNAAGGVVATGVTTIQTGVWYHIALVGSTVSTTAALTLYLNGVQEATVGSANIGSTAINRVAFFNSTPSAGSGNLDIDDIFVGAAATNPGDLRVETIRPTSAGNAAHWTPSASTNVSRVGTSLDSASYDSDTSYNSSATPGDIDSFVPEQLALTVATVYAIQTNIVARKDDANARQIADLIRQPAGGSGTDYVGATGVGLASTYTLQQQIHDQDPTGTDWTAANVNGDEFGYKEIA
jgi:hypothetical protein